MDNQWEHSLQVDLWGVSFTLQVPSKPLQDALQARYEAYLGASNPSWSIHLCDDPTLSAESPVWIEHVDAITRFQVAGFAGCMDFANRRAEVSAPSRELAHSAVERVMAYVCMQELPRHHNALLVHGAGIAIGGAGYLFFGASGRGKSTVARLAEGVGQVLSDELVIVQWSEEGATLLSTPFWGTGTPTEKVRRVPRQQVPVVALFSLQQAGDFARERLTPASAVMELLSSEKVATERISSADAWLATAELLVQTVPVYRLAFRPTVELWEFLELEVEGA